MVRLQNKFKKTASIQFHRPSISEDGATITEATEGESVRDQANAFFENVAGEGKITGERIAIVTEMDEKIRGEAA